MSWARRQDDGAECCPGVWGVPTGLMNQAPTRLRLVRASHRGVHRGRARIRFSRLPPIVGGTRSVASSRVPGVRGGCRAHMMRPYGDSPGRCSRMLPASGVSSTGLMNQAPTRLRLVRATHRGVQRGAAPLRSLSSPMSGGSMGLIQAHLAKMQQNAAGSLRVSLNPSCFYPPRVGDKGG